MSGDQYGRGCCPYLAVHAQSPSLGTVGEPRTQIQFPVNLQERGSPQEDPHHQELNYVYVLDRQVLYWGGGP